MTRLVHEPEADGLHVPEDLARANHDPAATSGPGTQRRQQDRLASRTQSQNVAGHLGDSHPNRVGGRLVHDLPWTSHRRPLPRSEEASDLRKW